MKKWITYIALSATAVTGAYGQQIDRSVRPAAAKAPVINIKDSEVFKTSNGITVIVSENHKLPRVSFNLVMGGRPMMEGSKAGVNDLMGKLILSGTTSRTKDVLDKEVDYMGATLSANGNSIYLSCLTKHLDKALGIMQDVTMNPSFPESEFERIKKQEESNLLSAKSDPGTMGANAEKKINFGNHPYGDVMNETTLAAITRDDVMNSFKQSFTPQGSYLVIVGDITPAAAKQLAEQYFGKWTGTAPYTADPGSGTVKKGNRVIFVNKPGAVQSTISISFPIDMKPGDPNQLPLTVMNNILGGGNFGARLLVNLREDKGYTYGTTSDLNVLRDGSWVSASGDYRNEVTDSAIVQLLYEFERITNEYVTAEELTFAKSWMAGNFARSLESPQTVGRFALSIIQNGLPADYYKTYLQRLEAVDREAVLQMAQTYFKNGYNIIVVGNESVLDKIRQFDSDGVIEKLDAFGNPVKEMKQADITADQLIENYMYAVTQTTSQKAMAKKLKKLKSIEKKTEFDLGEQGGGMKLLMTDVFQAPVKEYMKMEAGGMTFQSSFYDGTKGASTSMQEGRKELTAEELEDKRKSAGMFPEMNYKVNNVTYELKGIENVNGKDLYVLYVKNGDSEQYDYFTTDTHLKVKTISITKEGETTIENSDFKDVDGFLFSHSTKIVMGPMAMDGKVTSITVNGKVDPALFK